MANLEDSVPEHFNNDRQREKAIETGNTYISETVTERIEIPTANLGFITMKSLKKCWQVIAIVTDNLK